MSKKKTFGALLAGLVAVLSLGTYALACDGWHRVEKRFERYERMDLTDAQKKTIDQLKRKAVAAFSDDHRHGGCDAAHEATVARYAAEAERLVLNAEKVADAAAPAGKDLEALKNEVTALRQEIAELKALVVHYAKVAAKPADPSADFAAQVEKLFKLYQSGALDSKEYAAAKQKLFR